MEFLNVTGKGSFGMFWRLSLLVLSAALYQSASAADGVYKEVKWPMQAKTMIGTPSPWHFGPRGLHLANFIDATPETDPRSP